MKLRLLHLEHTNHFILCKIICFHVVIFIFCIIFVKFNWFAGCHLTYCLHLQGWFSEMQVLTYKHTWTLQTRRPTITFSALRTSHLIKLIVVTQSPSFHICFLFLSALKLAGHSGKISMSLPGKVKTHLAAFVIISWKQVGSAPKMYQIYISVFKFLSFRISTHFYWTHSHEITLPSLPSYLIM